MTPEELRACADRQEASGLPRAAELLRQAAQEMERARLQPVLELEETSE